MFQFVGYPAFCNWMSPPAVPFSIQTTLKSAGSLVGFSFSDPQMIDWMPLDLATLRSNARSCERAAVIKTSKRSIRTMFKPDDGAAYWTQQKERAPTFGRRRGGGEN